MITGEQVLQAAADSQMSPNTKRCLDKAIKKFSLLFQTDDIGTAYSRFEEVSRSFSGELVEYNVKYYMAALFEAAQLPPIAAALRVGLELSTQEEVDQMMQGLGCVVAECQARIDKKMSMKKAGVKPPRANRDEGEPGQGQASADGDCRPQSTEARVLGEALTATPTPTPGSQAHGATALPITSSEHVLWGRCMALETENMVLRAQLECTLERVEDMNRVVAGLLQSGK